MTKAPSAWIGSTSGFGLLSLIADAFPSLRYLADLNRYLRVVS